MSKGDTICQKETQYVKRKHNVKRRHNMSKGDTKGDRQDMSKGDLRQSKETFLSWPLAMVQSIAQVRMNTSLRYA